MLYTSSHMQKGRFRNVFEKVAVKRALLVGAALVLFMLGVLVGQGKIGIGTSKYASRSGLPSKLDYSQLDDVYKALRENYDGSLNESQVIDGLKHGLAQSANDPYTEYFTAKEAQDFNNDLQGTISGIGAQLELDQQENVVVVAPISGSPAEAAGLKAKDIIIAIDGKSTSGMTASQAVVKIRGKKGTQVKLTVVRNNKDQVDLTITRDTIHVPSVTSKLLDGNIGYLRVSQFSDDTDELARKAAQTFEDKGVKKVILDLRDNPGGEVNSAVGLASLWLDQGEVVVQEKRGNVVFDVSRATGDPLFAGMKTVVLVNAGSASASEITTLALRDQVDARVIGEQSFGKGVEQQLIPFSDGSALKVTVGKWYSPNGTNINKKGITPDQKVAAPADAKSTSDPQLEAAQAWLQQ